MCSSGNGSFDNSLGATDDSGGVIDVGRGAEDLRRDLCAGSLEVFDAGDCGLGSAS